MIVITITGADIRDPWLPSGPHQRLQYGLHGDVWNNNCRGERVALVSSVSNNVSQQATFVPQWYVASFLFFLASVQ